MPAQPYATNRARVAKKAIQIKLALVLLANLVAGILCAVYAASAYTHWQIVAAHPDQLNYPKLRTGDFKKGFIAAIGRIVWAVIYVIAGIFAPVWLNLLIAIVGLAWEIQLGEIETNNFGYLITIGYGEIYPADSSQCGNGQLSADQKSFFTVFAGISRQSFDDVCASLATEGQVLQIYCTIGLIAAFLFVLLVGVIGSLSSREKKSMWETGFSYLTSAL